MEGCNLWASFSPSTGFSRWLLVPDPGSTRFLPVKKGSFFFSLSPSAFGGFLSIQLCHISISLLGILFFLISTGSSSRCDTITTLMEKPWLLSYNVAINSDLEGMKVNKSKVQVTNF